MPERRAARFLLEVLFLAALAAALIFDHLRAAEIGAVMLVAWVVVAVFEWGALRQHAHYASGLPPRWSVPQMSLPPPRPLEPVGAGYPALEPAAEAPTWIASPAMLADWPVTEVEPEVDAVEPPIGSSPDELTQVHDAFAAELAVALAEVYEEPAPLEEPPEEPEPEPAPEPAPEEIPPVPHQPAPVRMARHHIDPFDEPAAKARRFSRRRAVEVASVEVRDRPGDDRPIPARWRGDD